MRKNDWFLDGCYGNHFINEWQACEKPYSLGEKDNAGKNKYIFWS